MDNNLIHIPGYSDPIRHDRFSKRGGGVCIYSKEDITCRRVTQVSSPPDCIECIWTVIPLCKVIVLAIYVPPNLQATQLNDVVEYVISQADIALNTVEDGRLIIVGDINRLPTIELESTLSLTQCVNVPTRGFSTLDKILIDESLQDDFENPVVGANFGNADHLSVYLKPHTEITSVKTPIKVYDYRRSHMDAFVAKLRSQPWQNLYRSEDSIDTKCSIFYDFVSQAHSCIPYHQVIFTSNDKPWVTPTLKVLINRRFEAFRSGNFNKYRHFKTKVKSEILKAKAAWLQKLKASPYGIWKAVSTSSSSSKRHQCFHDLISQYSSLEQLANSLNDTFSSAFSKASSIDSEELSDSPSDKDWNIDISTESVSNILKHLKQRKSAGNDNLNSRLLIVSHEVLAGPLSHLFSISVQTCQVPRRWKEATVVPVPKTRNPSLVDFRPISLLSIPSKILESLVLESVKSQLISSYGTSQYGFRPGSSTLNAHIAIHDYVTRQLDLSSTNGVVMIAVDLSKAFDRLSHRSLLQSMLRAGLPKSFVKWTANFLSDRKQRVTFQGVKSKNELKVTSGVPQGSILAPYFFAFHLGSLTAAAPQTVLIKYADDITILIPYKISTDPSIRAKEEIANIETWCQMHGLTINHDKTQTAVFTNSKSREVSVHNIPNLKPHLSILGVIFEDSLKWDLHVNTVSKKASQRIHVLRMLKKIPSSTRNDLVQVYRNYIQSIMEYNSPLFVGLNKKNNAMLERINKRCHRIICGLDCNCDGFPPMSERRLKQATKFFNKIMSPENISHHLVPHSLPRTQHLFIEYMRTDRRAKSFIPFCSLLHNTN